MLQISEEATSNTYIQSNSNAGSSTCPPFAKSSVDNFISSSVKKLKYTA